MVPVAVNVSAGKSTLLVRYSTDSCGLVHSTFQTSIAVVVIAGSVIVVVTVELGVLRVSSSITVIVSEIVVAVPSSQGGKIKVQGG